MRNQATMMGRGKDDWETPDAFWRKVDAAYRFTLDAAARKDNAKVSSYYSDEPGTVSAFVGPWRGRVWCNPPYGDVARWVQHAAEEWARHGAAIVMLVAGRTETAWYQDWAWTADRIILLRRRLRFVGAPDDAPFPSHLVIWESRETPRIKPAWPLFQVWDWKNEPMPTGRDAYGRLLQADHLQPGPGFQAAPTGARGPFGLVQPATWPGRPGRGLFGMGTP